MSRRVYVGTKPVFRDALGEKIRLRIMHDLNIGTVNAIRTATVYTINGDLTSQDLHEVASGPLSDPVIQDYTIDATFCKEFDWLVEVGFLPGVTDNVGRTAREACCITLQRKYGEEFSVHTGTHYFIEGNLSRKHAQLIASSLLANELINSIAVYTRQEWLLIHQDAFAAPLVKGDDSLVTASVEVSLDGTDESLAKISKDGMLALTLDEMKIIKDYFARPDVRKARGAKGLPVSPTNVELEILAQTWSEHCKHKIFNARITYRQPGQPAEVIGSLFKDYVQRTTKDVREMLGKNDFCLSVFKDNAGVVQFNDSWAIVFKCETHNSPSALDPYGGALTGIVGVNRDPFGTGLGCRLIANTDVFCFASPFYEGKIPPRILHPKRVFDGVREGVEHGGNKSGIPTVNGTIVFDDRFLGKPLVYCGTLGVMPLEINGRKGYEKKANPGDRIIMVGGRIGKDGIHGATFSSEPLHEGSPATAVQIGDPITQKRMTDFLLRARDRNLYSAITDNGAGGLSSSVGEMAQDTGGATVHTDRAPVKYHGLQPWEIIVSEAQERMTVAVPVAKVQEFLDLSAEWNVESTDLGEFTADGYFTIVHNGQTVARIEMTFLHDGLPKMELDAVWAPPVIVEGTGLESADCGADLLAMMGRLNICSKEYVIRQYDHEVQGGSVVKPLCGARNDGPSDAAVFRPLLDSVEAVVVSNGIVPRYSDIDTYAMAACAVDEAVRNAVCTGANPDYLAGLDNFCWCDPVKSADNPDGDFKLGQLVRANKALYDICMAYRIPLISGKDSMKNDYRIGDTRISIPPTLLFSLVSRMPDASRAVTMDLKEAGNALFLLGTTYRELGASEYALYKNYSSAHVPQVHNPAQSMEMYRKLYASITAGYIRSCHDCSDGGLGVALVEMSFAGELGLNIDLRAVVAQGCSCNAEVLFSESQSRIVVEVSQSKQTDFERMFQGLPCSCIGTIVRGEAITITGLDGTSAAKLSRIDCKAAWKKTLDF